MFNTATTISTGGPYAITAGLGALWFTESGAIGRIVPATGATTEDPLPRSTSDPRSIVSGPDGALWFTEDDENRIGRMSWDGVVTEYALPNANSYPTSIVSGPDGALWFVEAGIPSGPGQRSGGNRIGRITTDGVMSEYSIPTPASGVSAIATAGDGSLWFTETTANQIGKLVAIANPLSVAAPASIAAGTVSVSYPATTFQAQGGTPPYYWSASGLPPGLTLSTSGVLSGAPSFSGSYTPVVQLSDSSTPGLVARRSYSLSVNSATSLTIATGSALPEATAATTYTLTLSALGGTPPYIWSVIGALPDGLSLNSASGVLSGTPTAAGNFSFTLSVADSTQTSTVIAATLTVASSGGRGGDFVHSAVLSQVSYGGGWQSSVYLVNPSASPLDLIVNFHSDAGGALSLPLAVTQGPNIQFLTASTVSATLQPYATLLIEGDVPSPPSPVETSGWAEVLSARPVEGYGVFHYTSRAGVQSEGTVPLETALTSSFALPFDNLNRFQTGVALTNLSSQAALIAVIMWDENGKQIAVQSVEVPASGHTSFMLSDRLPAATVQRGVVQFRSTAGSIATGLGLRVNPLGGFTSIPKLAGLQ